MKRDLPAGVRARVAELVDEYSLADSTVSAFESLLVSMEDEHSPTAVHDPAEGVNVHIADSLSAFAVEGLAAADRIADIGSGGGMPALVLAAALPSVEVVAIESVARKCEFITEAATFAGIGNCVALWSRAEEWREGLCSCDFVTARALAALPVIAEYSAPLLRNGGRLIAWKAQLPADELSAGNSAGEILGLDAARILEGPRWPGSGARKLVVMTKTGKTPERFPRRPGMAIKRPLA